MPELEQTVENCFDRPSGEGRDWSTTDFKCLLRQVSNIKAVSFATHALAIQRMELRNVRSRPKAVVRTRTWRGSRSAWQSKLPSVVRISRTLKLRDEIMRTCWRPFVPRRPDGRRLRRGTQGKKRCRKRSERSEVTSCKKYDPRRQRPAISDDAGRPALRVVFPTTMRPTPQLACHIPYVVCFCRRRIPSDLINPSHASYLARPRAIN